MLFFNQKNPMKKYLFFIVVLVSVLSSCKNDKKIEENSNQAIVSTKSGNPNNAVKSNSDEVSLPNPCDLISVKQLSEVLDVDKNLIEIKSTANAGKYSTSCALSWENVENGSDSKLFLILQSNPLPDDIEEWAKSFIEAKIENGDMGYPNNGTPYIYEPIKGFDGLVAYNDELRRVYWQAKGDLTIAIYYNAGFTESNRKRFAAKIAKIMNRNL